MCLQVDGLDIFEVRDNTLHSIRMNEGAATDEKSVEVRSDVCEGRENPAGEANTPPDIKVLQPGQGGDDLHQAEVSEAGGGQAEVVEAGGDLGHLDQALLTHQTSPAVGQVELAQVTTLEAVAEAETGDGAPAEVEISQLQQLSETAATTASSGTLVVTLHQLHREALSFSLQNHFYLSSEEKIIKC